MFLSKNIQPFNKVFFYNCTHSCLFSILNANNGDYREFMVNSIPYLSVRCNEKESWFLVRLKFMKDHEEIIKKQGFSIEKLDYHESMCDFLHTKLLDNCSAIVSVDCYELDYRKDLYKIECWPHSILVYDYDEEKHVFKVIDQPNRDDVVFECYYISGPQLEKAIRLYWENSKFDEEYNSDIIIVFYCNDYYYKRENKELFEEWKNNRIINEELILNGISAVEAIIPEMVSTLENIDNHDIHAGENLLSGLNDVVKQKKWEQTFIMNIAEQKEKYSIINEIYSEWDNVRKSAGLIILSRRVRQKSLINFEKKLKYVLNLERKLQNIVCNEEEKK